MTNWAGLRAWAHNTPRAQIPKEGMPLVPAQVGGPPEAASGELGLASSAGFTNRDPRNAPRWFSRSAERYHAAGSVGPADRIEIVVGDAVGVAALQAESDKVQGVGGVAAHDAAELTGGRYIYSVIRRGKRNVDLDLGGAGVHEALVGWLVRCPRQNRDRGGFGTRGTNAPRQDSKRTDHSTPSPPCIVCPCAPFMDDGAVRLPRQTRLFQASRRKLFLSLQNGADKCRGNAFDQSVGMAGLEYQGHEVQDQRFASTVTGEGPPRIRRKNTAMRLIPLDRESD